MKFIIILSLFLSLSGCASFVKKDLNAAPEERIAEDLQKDVPSEIEIKEFILSPGDKIRIVVLGYDALSRSIIIPMDGKFIYPLVGEVEAKGKTIKEVWETISGGLANYREVTISPGDEISIMVYNNEEFNRKLILPPDEKFFYPFAGEINTNGKTLSDIRKVITESLTTIVRDPQVSIDLVSSIKPKILVNPQVSVEVTEYGGQKVFVLGEVNKPGVFYVGAGMTTIEAISMAGGFTNDAKPEEVLLVKNGMDKSGSNIKKIDVKKFLNGQDLTQNMNMYGGDIIYVPSSFIADVDRFFRHFATIINPVVTLETGIILAPELDNAFKRGSGGEDSPRIIIPPR